MRKFLVLSLTGLGLCSSVRADELCFSSGVPIQPTAWQNNVTVPTFFGGAGTLNCVSITIEAHLQGAARVENLGLSATSVDLEWSAHLEVRRPDGSLLANVDPARVIQADLDAFDGAVDFLGGSGRTFDGLSEIVSQTVHLQMTPQDMQLFTASPVIMLPVTASGSSFAASSGQVIASFDQSAGAVVNACYVYAAIGNYCTSNPNSTGGAAVMSWAGSSSLASNDLTLMANPLPAGCIGLFIVSPDRMQMPLGDGNLCVGWNSLGYIARLSPVVADSAGVLLLDLDNSLAPTPDVHFDPGSTWNFQAWFQDPQSLQSGFNLSDGLSVSFCP